MMKDQFALAIMAMLASGCVASQSARFRPVQASSVGGRGYPATQQTVQIAGKHAGRVSVWSPGLYPPRQGERPIVHVTLRITNDGRAPMQLDMEATSLGITTGARVLPSAHPYHVAGNTTIAPGQEQRVDLYYALPEGVTAWRVVAFNQSWGVQTSAGKFTQYTPFSRYRQRRRTRVYRHSRYGYLSYWRHHHHRHFFGYHPLHRF